MDLRIIILNYNGRKWLEELLPSLYRNWIIRSAYQLEVVVVDNASSDASIPYLQTLDYVKIIRSETNCGFAAGNNLALHSTDARYVMLLNSDITVPDTANNPDALLLYMDQNPGVAVLTPHLILDNGKTDPACHRGEPTPWASLTYMLGLEKYFPESKLFARYHQGWKRMQSVHTVDACSGAAMLVRRSAMDSVGLLDERFFMYAEDLDWCKRFREQQYEIIFYPLVSFIHHKYKSGLEGGNPTVKKSFYNTMLQYYDKHYKNKYPIFRAFLKCYIQWKNR